VGTDCEINCSWTEIRKQLDEQRNNNRDRRQAFLQKTNVCDEVVFLTEAMIELDYYNAFLGSVGRRERLFGKETMDKEVLMNELNEAADKYFNSGLYSDTHFRFIAAAYIPAARFFTQMFDDIDLVDWTNEIAKTDVIKDFMFTVQAGYALIRKDLDNFEKYSIHVNNEYLLDRLMQEYKITRTKMENPENISAYVLGSPVDFTTFSIEQNVIGKTNAPNYGKVQVINIGASWCGPCKPVLEQFAALDKEYAGMNVCFSFICITPDNLETRIMYRERGINDATVHFTTKDEYEFLVKMFSPMGLPYGILLNRKGVVVDWGTHVRPSENLREKINLLLKQDKLIK
jgi:thiol-disulfide isomerase/thioredoxin